MKLKMNLKVVAWATIILAVIMFSSLSKPSNIWIRSVQFVLNLIMLIGFIAISKKVKLDILKIASYVVIIWTIIHGPYMLLADMADNLIGQMNTGVRWFNLSYGIIMFLVYLLFGIAVSRLEKIFGGFCFWAGMCFIFGSVGFPLILIIIAIDPYSIVPLYLSMFVFLLLYFYPVALILSSILFFKASKS
jgi:hypothetical protein